MGKSITNILILFSQVIRLSLCHHFLKRSTIKNYFVVLINTIFNINFIICRLAQCNLS